MLVVRLRRLWGVRTHYDNDYHDYDYHDYHDYVNNDHNHASRQVST
jgi:hypothetical protein